MTGVQIVEAIVDILVSGLTGIGEGIGVALSSMATAIFVGAEGLTVFGVLIIVFAAISLGLDGGSLILRNISENWAKTVKTEMLIPC